MTEVVMVARGEIPVSLVGKELLKQWGEPVCLRMLMIVMTAAASNILIEEVTMMVEGEDVLDAEFVVMNGEGCMEC